MLDEQIPVFVVSARTQETEVFRDPVSQEARAGNPNGIGQIGYVFILQRFEDEMGNECVSSSADASLTARRVTGGWRVIDAARRGGSMSV